MGTAGKLVNNLAMYGNGMVARECLDMGMKVGLDLKQIIQVMRVSTGNSRSLNTLARRILEPGPTPAPPPKPAAGRAPVKDLGTKDNELAMEMAEAAGAEMPISRFMMQQVEADKVYDALGKAMR